MASSVAEYDVENIIRRKRQMKRGEEKVCEKKCLHKVDRKFLFIFVVYIS